MKRIISIILVLFLTAALTLSVFATTTLPNNESTESTLSQEIREKIMQDVAQKELIAQERADYYELGYNRGYSAGYDDGYSSGCDDGYSSGYDAGYTVAQEQVKEQIASLNLTMQEQLKYTTITIIIISAVFLILVVTIIVYHRRRIKQFNKSSQRSTSIPNTQKRVRKGNGIRLISFRWDIFARIFIWIFCFALLIIANHLIGRFIDLQFFPDGVIVGDDRILAVGFWNSVTAIVLLTATIFSAKKLCKKLDPYKFKNKSIQQYLNASSFDRQRIFASVPEWYIEICEDKNKTGVIKKYLFESACKKVINWEQFGCLYCEYVHSAKK